MRAIVRGLLSGVIILLFVLFGPLSASRVFGQKSVPVGRDEAEKWREDIRFMADEMPKRHKNLFHQATREQFDAAVANLYERVPTLARHQIIVGMERIVAMIGDGHTNISPTRDPKIGFRTYPIRLYFFVDGLYIRSAASDLADNLGWRVVKIGNLSTDEAYNAVRELIGRDNNMDAKFFAPFLLAMPEILHALGIVDDLEQAPFLIEKDGRQKTITLKPAGLADMMPPDTDLSWLPKTSWTDAQTATASPLWRRDPQNKFWFEYLADLHTVYMQFNQVGNKDDETLETFTKRLFAFIDANQVDRFVLDLRLNRGGNGELNRPLLLGIIRSRIDRPGTFFTIIGRSTFSAAQFLVNDLEKYTNTLFVGEPSGGKVNSYGDSRKIILPNSGITVRVSTLWWQEDERDKRQWTSPQIAAELSFADYQKGTDPALNAILKYAPPAKSLTDSLAEAVTANDLKLAADIYRTWRNDPVNKYRDPEDMVNSLGYEFLGKKQVPQAIEVFKLNVAAFPLSANVYDSLGDGYVAAGDKASAIKSYENALSIDPRLSSAIDALRTLRGK